MNFLRGLFLALVLLTGFFSVSLWANDNYWLISQEKDESNTEEDLYFTWLGCHSCLLLEEQLDLTGLQTLPLVARTDWRAAAKIQVAMQMLKVNSEVIDSFKQRILDSQLDVKNLEAMKQALVDLGVEQETLEQTLNSKALFSAILQAEQKAKQYKIQYVPTAVIKGRYATDAKSTGSIAKFIETVNLLKNK